MKESLVREKQPQRCLHTWERTFVLHTSLFMSLRREKLGLWKGDLAYIHISRCVVYTRAGAGGFLSSFLKLHFQVVLRLIERLGKSNCNIENSLEQRMWAQYDWQAARLASCTAVARAPALLQPRLISR